MIYRLFFIVFFILSNITFSEVYTPKTSKEREIFNNLKKEKLVIALSDGPFYNLSYPNIPSLNEVAKTFFKDYMGLNVTFKTIPYKNLGMELKSGNIDGVALIPKSAFYDNYLDFSNSIFSEELFVISQNIEVNSITDLNNKIIYTSHIKSYNNILNAILENNNLSSYPIAVDNLDNYKDKLILTTTPALYKPNFGIKISHSSGISMAFLHRYKGIIPFVNDALKNSYRERFSNTVTSLNRALSYNNFYTSLTPEEIDYLKTRAPIKVAYENRTNSLISFKSLVDGTYKGIAPNIFKTLKNLNIDFTDVTTDIPKTTSDLENRSIDAILLSKTRKRSKNFIFSKKIYEIGVFVVSLDSSHASYGTIGVLSDTVEEHLARRYDIDSNVVVFHDLKSMIRALNTGKVNSLLVTNKEDFDSKRYHIVPFETIPINLTFNKEDRILRDIIDKAFQHSIDIPRLADIAALEKEMEEKILYQKNKEIRNLLILASVLFVAIIVAVSTYLYRERLNKKTLLKDSLTDLPNRFIFDQFCNEQNSISGCTFVIDLNNFKNINDSLGHEFGDMILKEFANFLKNSFIGSYIFRISGDEFYGFSFESSKDIINKLKKFKEFCPNLLKYNITFNLGISYKSSNVSLATSFKYSDLAMLESKKDKINFFKIADENFIEKMNRESSILSLLKENVSGIYPVYQPKFCIKTKRLIGAEALARYNSLELGSIGPFEFIPIAEKYNFIHKVDYKIAKDTIVFIKELIENNSIPSDNFKISFNISMKTFKRDDLITIIAGLLSYFKVPGKYIEIEITESIFVLDMKDLITKLKALKTLGIQISLDDFTAGHSTAGLLPLLPIDIVKFDKSLLDSIEVNSAKGEIVYRNLITLIKDLNFKIVSEGVETKKQLDFLMLLHVDYAQGYYFSKPISKEEFTMEVKKI